MAEVQGQDWAQRYAGRSPVFTQELILERLQELKVMSGRNIDCIRTVNNTNEYSKVDETWKTKLSATSMIKFIDIPIPWTI
jgi:hypothetical protein